MFALAAERTGALIVIARRDSLKELTSGGIAMGADMSPEILTAIFQKYSPVHDGAVLIEANRISRAGVVLPLTQRDAIPAEYGTRHRAAMGMAERCDALVVVVSEERGEVTLMHGRQIVPVADAADLLNLLQSLLARPPVTLPVRIRRWLFSDLRYKLAAAGLVGPALGHVRADHRRHGAAGQRRGRVRGRSCRHGDRRTTHDTAGSAVARHFLVHEFGQVDGARGSLRPEGRRRGVAQTEGRPREPGPSARSNARSVSTRRRSACAW